MHGLACWLLPGAREGEESYDKLYTPTIHITYKKPNSAWPTFHHQNWVLKDFRPTVGIHYEKKAYASFRGNDYSYWRLHAFTSNTRNRGPLFMLKTSQVAPCYLLRLGPSGATMLLGRLARQAIFQSMAASSQSFRVLVYRMNFYQWNNTWTSVVHRYTNRHCYPSFITYRPHPSSSELQT